MGIRIFLLFCCVCTHAFGMVWQLPGYFSRIERIGSGKEVTPGDKMRAKALGPNICVQRVPIGFQTKCIIINYKHNCTMTNQYRTVFHCCPGYAAVLQKSGCPHELYVTNKTVIEEAKKLGLSTLAMLIGEAGLDPILSGKTKYTLLAPSEAAFKNVGKATLKKLLADKKTLSRLLLRHVIKGKVPSTALKNNQFVSTMDSSKLRVNLFHHGRVVTLNGARVTSANNGASNGIIHVIDSVLEIPKISGEKILAGRKDLSLFRKALAMNNITVEDGQTILAPLNKAFNDIDSSIFSRLLQSPKCLRNLLLNHVIQEPVFTTVLEGTRRKAIGFRTKEGKAYQMRSINGTVMIGKASLIKSDILGTNAVIQIIDSVLVPTSALTVLEVAKLRGAHKFTNLIKEAKLRHLIKENGKYTIFAPSDAALERFVQNSSTDSLRNITDIIKYHIVPRSVQTCEFENDMLLDTLDGDNKIRINVYEYGLNNAVQGVCLGSSKCNIEACNGAVHVISEVLQPAKKSLSQIFENDQRFTAFAAALKKAKLDSLLTGKHPLTIFAPTNAAFSKFEPQELEKLLADEWRLKNMLKYHIVRSTYFPCAFSNECPLISMNGRSVLIEMNKDIIKINGAKVTGKEEVAENGVIYPIDCILKRPRSTFSSFWQIFGY